MNILFVVRNISYGGAGKQLAMLANALAWYGRRVAINSYNWLELQQPLRDSEALVERAMQVLHHSDMVLRFIERSRSKLKVFSPRLSLQTWMSIYIMLLEYEKFFLPLRPKT